MNVQYTKENFKKLLQILNAKTTENRVLAAEDLCWFVENYHDNLDFNFLVKSIDELIEILTTEQNNEVGFKIGETIFEFIWLEKLDANAEKKVIEKLANLKTQWIFPSYLDQEEYLHLPGVKEYINKYRTSS